MTIERERSHAIAALLAARGINEIVVSPGSRNAPLIEAIARESSIKKTVVIDERSAAFVALGKASVLQQCVALLCTSGTALLNYAPALAEARYRNIPLLAITADRAHEWINRNDAQTIEQQNVYANFIKRSFSIDARDSNRHISLTVNEAIDECTHFPYGPVHLNIEIPDPSIIKGSDDTYGEFTCDVIEYIAPDMTLGRNMISSLATRLQAPAKVMIVGGAYGPDRRLNRAIGRLCSFGNFIVLADSISNLHGQGVINCIDTVLSGIDAHELNDLAPDIVISHGAAILSSQLKQYLRHNRFEHWHIGITDRTQDTYGSLTKRIETDPATFYCQLVSAMRRNDASSDYTHRWIATCNNAVQGAKKYISTLPWCDLKAVASIMEMTPQNYNIQLSNGMSVRYAQLLPNSHHRVDCNRGVSGIEGSTSTAIGASSVYSGNTLLVTGDMSAVYDLNALTLTCKSHRFKMVVIDNGGGGIFKYIKGTNSFEEIDRYMLADPDCDIAGVALSAGFKVFNAGDESELYKNFKLMLAENERSSVLVVKTSAAESAQIMQNYINRTK